MSRSSTPSTQTTTSEPPSYLRPYLQTGAQRADQLYRMGGTPVVGPSFDTNSAMNAARFRAIQGSPVTDAAQGLAAKTLQGGFLGRNPYLDATFNRAAQGVTNQVQSNFGMAGRNIRGADAAGVAADRYSNLANQIYGGAYESERDRMQQVIPFANQLANQDYVDIGQLSNVGAQQEAYQREQNEQPGRTLDEYIARLQGFPGGTVTQTTPMQRNVLGQAAAGAGLGSMFGPWGTLIGGLGGAIFG